MKLNKCQKELTKHIRFNETVAISMFLEEFPGKIKEL